MTDLGCIQKTKEILYNLNRYTPFIWSVSKAVNTLSVIKKKNCWISPKQKTSFVYMRKYSRLMCMTEAYGTVMKIDEANNFYTFQNGILL